MVERVENYDVVVVGAGAAGIAAAISAARNGARTLLLDAGPMPGGELISGMPVLGCLSSAGSWTVGGIAKDLFAQCEAYDGYIGVVSDYRTLHAVAFDPEVMKLAVVKLLHDAGVEQWLYSFAEQTIVESGRVRGIYVRNKSGRSLIVADVFIDCSGDADLAISAGAAYEAGEPATGAFQALSLIYRLSGINIQRLLEFIAQEPDSFGLKDNHAMGLSRDECITALLRQGQPKAAALASGPLLTNAMARGDIFPLSNIAIAPVSTQRREVSINANRVADIDATDTAKLSSSLPELMEQITICTRFLHKHVPGFEEAVFSGVAPRIGIRETRRIVGEDTLSGTDVLTSRHRTDTIARGAHEIDVHASGTAHQRQEIPGGGYYDIPFGCLIPKGLANVLVAGRCLSSTREGHSSARVMGPCLAMGQAVGTAAAAFREKIVGNGDVRDVPVSQLQSILVAQGAILGEDKG